MVLDKPVSLLFDKYISVVVDKGKLDPDLDVLLCCCE